VTEVNVPSPQRARDRQPEAWGRGDRRHPRARASQGESSILPTASPDS